MFAGAVITIGVSVTNRKRYIIQCEKCGGFERAKLLSFIYFFLKNKMLDIHYKSNSHYLIVENIESKRRIQSLHCLQCKGNHYEHLFTSSSYYVHCMCLFIYMGTCIGIFKFHIRPF